MSAGIKKTLCGMLAVLALVLGMAFCGGEAAAAENARQVVRLGTWNGSPLEWYVLYSKDGKSLLMLKEDKLPHRPFHPEGVAVTWESCSLRRWLNGEFYGTAFSASEQERILEVTVPAHPNTGFDVDSGRDTQDKVFLLSVNEARGLLRGDSVRLFMNESANAPAWWWLRSPGYHARAAAGIHPEGGVFDYGNCATYADGAVRPVLWVSR